MSKPSSNRMLALGQCMSLNVAPMVSAAVPVYPTALIGRKSLSLKPLDLILLFRRLKVGQKVDSEHLVLKDECKNLSSINI